METRLFLSCLQISTIMSFNEQRFSEQQVAEHLKRFFEVMGQWEANCKASYRKVKQGESDYETVKSEWIDSLKGVFREYCVSWDRPARTRHGIQVSMIPTYGPELEDILSIEVMGEQAKVVTQQRSGAKDKLVYRLCQDGHQWRIYDDRKRIVGDAEVDWDL